MTVKLKAICGCLIKLIQEMNLKMGPALLSKNIQELYRKILKKMQKVENIQEFQAMLKEHFLPNFGNKQRLSEYKTTTSKEIISDRERNDFHLSDTEDNFSFEIKYLNIYDNALRKIPNKIYSFKYLTALNLGNNHLESLPEDLGTLYNLVTLKLSRNKLNCLPKSLRHIQQLNYLDISHNNFLEVPDVLYYGLRLLRVLDLSHNKISTFNEPPVCINKLVILILSQNVLIQMPVWIFDSICHLQILDVSGNQVCYHPELATFFGTGIFESLQLLNMENCNYTTANIQMLCDFRNLETLHLGNKKDLNAGRVGKNYFGNFTMNVFKNLTCIKYLYMQNIQIATLPSDFDCLKSINILDLCDNLLSWLPECFCNLISLRTLYLTSNQLFFLPKNIGYLVNLQQIHLGNNKLRQIPESFYNLSNLEFVDFYNNKIEKIDKKILEGKHLKGIDLGQNCLDFSLFEYDDDPEKFMNLYGCLKKSFRMSFGVLECRHDVQMLSLPKATGSIGSDSQTFDSVCSVSSFESEQLTDSEDPPVFVSPCKNDSEDEDWERSSCNIEYDDLFDPNEDNVRQPIRNSWSLEFQKNYCPAKYRVSSLKKIFVKNFKLALKKETVEGQFDSD